jgi:hypothetical protein
MMTKRLGFAVVLFTASLYGADIKQNWQFANQFWTQDQGSKIMRWDWIMHLEKADGTGLLKDDLTTFGFIPGALKETGLPVGFAKHVDREGEWVGITCAACHTAMWKVNGETVQVEGGPSMLDLDTFATVVVAALDKTVNDPTTFARFTEATHATNAEVAQVRDQLQKQVRVNAHPVPAGFGRIDAFGRVFNQISIFALGNDEKYAHAPRAPVSYPCLWDVAQEEFVQWNGSAANLGVEGDGSKLRNIGEVMAAFAQVDVPPNFGPNPKFTSSVNKDGMVNLEHWVAALVSPSWPGELDQDKLRRGAQVYQEAKCGTCHQVLKDKTDRSHLKVYLTPLDEVQTDRAQADQFRLTQIPTRMLQGKQKLVVPLHPLATFAATDYGKDVFSYFVLGVFNQLFNPQLKDLVHDFAKMAQEGLPPALTVYKARPLNGIWATAPYLHNGSVPNLWDMLQRPEQRSQRFCVGNRILDVKRVGYDPDNHTEPCFVLDTSYAGNSNVGHTYGVDLPDSDKWALIEYLKSL